MTVSIVASAANHYEGELAQLGDSYAAACAADIEALKLAIASTAEASIKSPKSVTNSRPTCWSTLSARSVLIQATCGRAASTASRAR